MVDSLQNFGDAKLAAEVIDAYAHDLTGLDALECGKLGIDDAKGKVLVKALGTGKDGIITDDEYVEMMKAGFAKDFINVLSGINGKDALSERVKWLTNRLSGRWCRFTRGETGRIGAINKLGDIGPDTKDAVSALIEALKDGYWDVREAAAEALGKIGAPAVPALIEALRYGGSDVRYQAANALGKIGPAAKDAVPALIKALEDGGSDVPEAAMEALIKIGAPAVPALIEALKDGYSDVRRASANALGKIGPDAKDAVSALIEALKDGSWRVQVAAANALAKIGAPAVPALFEALKDSKLYVREAAAWALGKIGAAARDAIFDLELMRDNDPDPDCKKAAGEALEKIEEGMK